MERIRWRFGKREGGSKTWQWGLATALQQSQIVYLAGALFVGIAYQPFIFMLVGLQCALWSYVQRTERVPNKAKFKRSGSQVPTPRPRKGVAPEHPSAAPVALGPRLRGGA